MSGISSFLLSTAAAGAMSVLQRGAARLPARLQRGAPVAMRTARDGLGAPDVCILGGGFGGLYTALRLSSLDWGEGPRPRVTLVDQSDRFVFLPMLYELTTGEAACWQVAPLFSEVRGLPVAKTTPSALSRASCSLAARPKPAACGSSRVAPPAAAPIRAGSQRQRCGLRPWRGARDRRAERVRLSPLRSRWVGAGAAVHALHVSRTRSDYHLAPPRPAPTRLADSRGAAAQPGPRRRAQLPRRRRRARVRAAILLTR